LQELDLTAFRPDAAQVANELCTGFSYLVNLRQMHELAMQLNKTDDATALSNAIADVVELFNKAFCAG
jgi:hypothetical protein